MAHHSDVSNCVASIIHAFTDGFAVFRRLREKRRKKKSRKAGSSAGVQPGAQAGEELRLSNSLRRGPADIQTQYERNYGVAGERFAKGDAIAHASLAETLLKLNTGLVGIIASFLNHDRNETVPVDYKSLTNLSDASRAEAIDTLNQLYQRLSQSNVALYQLKPGCPHCGSAKHAKCGAVASRPGSEKSRKKHAGGKAGSTTRSRSRSNTPTITRVPMKSSAQTQLAIVRPRNRRTGSTSSANSTITPTRSSSTASTVVNTPMISPLASPAHRKVDPFTYQIPLSPRAEQPSPKPAATPRRKSSSAPEQRPQTWAHPGPEPTTMPPIPPPKPVKAATTPIQPPHAASSKQLLSPLSPGFPGKASAVPRRLDKATPSAYSFASDSTKLGEIPMRNWTIPFDFEMSARLNEEALARGWPVEPQEIKEKPKKRLFGFLRRGSGDE